MIKIIKRLSKCIREYKKPAFVTMGFIVLEAIIETIMPFVVAELVNEINAGCGLNVIVEKGLILLGLSVLSLASGAIAGFTCAKASAGFLKNLRHDIFRKIQSFSFENIDKFSSASLVTRMTVDAGDVFVAYMMLIRLGVRCPLMFIFSIAMSYYMGGALATMFVVVVPLLVVSFILIAKAAMPRFKKVFRKYDKLNETIEENVMAMRVVKGFSREDFEKKKFDKASDDIRKEFTVAERLVAINSPVMQVCIYTNMVFVLLLGSKLVITSGGANLDVGQLSAMLTYGVQVLMSLLMLSMFFVMGTIALEAANRIIEVLDEEPAIKNPENAITEIKDGSIDFTNVSFKYSSKAEKFALSDINLHIPSGTTVGILGGTGASKSTLVQLISRLYDVTEGSVKVGGRDVREYDIAALRDACAVVLQKNVLFSGTVRENLQWGNPDATDEEIREACKLAQADEFIMAHKDGYDRFIEQGGTNVSGGQRQRICIARALLKKPKILIFDDSTSAVDTKTDAIIRKGLAKYMPDTTKIIIAQRVASVEQSDVILVMDGGTISAMGTHAELMQSSTIYREIYEQQNRNNGVDDSADCKIESDSIEGGEAHE